MEILKRAKRVYSKYPELVKSANWPNHVKVVEVSPRDGLQNEKTNCTYRN